MAGLVATLHHSPAGTTWASPFSSSKSTFHLDFFTSHEIHLKRVDQWGSAMPLDPQWLVSLPSSPRK